MERIDTSKIAGSLKRLAIIKYGEHNSGGFSSCKDPYINIIISNIAGSPRGI